MESTTQLNLSILLPHIEAGDHCANFLLQRLAGVRGIQKAHIVDEEGQTRLCLHYDNNLITLAAVERAATEGGAEVSGRYQHEQISFSRMKTADGAQALESVLQKLPGMLHARVNYAAGLIFVAYDTTLLKPEAIQQAIAGMGSRVLASPTHEAHEHEHSHGHDHAGHSHGSAPAFLPHWMQHNWTFILVGLAGLFFAVGAAGERFLDMPSSLSLVFFLLSYAAGSYDIATEALPGLLKGKFNTDILMLAAALGAAILGEWSEGAFLLFLFSLGHAGEHYALDRARNAVSELGALMPKTARVKRGSQIIEENVEQLQLDDVVIARPGDRIPVDGEVVSGSSAVDQSPITGESVPVTKTIGGAVFAGTVNKDNALEIKVTRLAADNTLMRVMNLVAEAQSQQSPTQQLADRFTSRFVPLIFIATALMIVVPPLLGLLTWEASFYRAMLLLVAASPCALAIGTPAAVLAGIAQAARSGVLVKGGVHLENLGRLKAIAFDKTGTITRGTFSVTDVLPLNGVSADDLLAVVGAVEQQSSHPLAQAVVRAAQEKGLQLPPVDGLENVPGRGVRSTVAGQPVSIGSLKLFGETPAVTVDKTVSDKVDALEKSGRSTMLVSRGGQIIGILGLADTPRPNINVVMNRLRRLGIDHLVMLTGDNREVASNIAQQVGLTDVQAELLPEDKLNTVKSLQQKYEAIAMIGDGVNDAPALATATVGIAMGGAGTAVALETADVALMGDDLGKLPFAVGLSRASRSIIQQNLFISLGVIALLMLTSVFGIVQLGVAVILHEGSTLVVVGNALRLLRYRDQA